MFDCHCRACSYWFFLEEAYDAETDDIICPRCNASLNELGAQGK